MTDHRPPRRVRVTRTTPYRIGQPPTTAVEPSAGAPVADPVYDVYESDLRRALLRWAAVILAVVTVPLFGLPLVLVLVPGLATAEVVGVPLPWLLLAVGFYPLVWLAGRWYVAGAERAERDHVDELAERDAGST